ncbi:MAG: geranylgeranylglyceryl/heptaprenylglyceryl phosphate synthase [Candidatus Eisenbacteria bacterium]|nr:geranylgeranylglyceryl/heptaprenylglyceryl phosphate synthase [Candidatus Eisenbacteria bacterium]
MSTVLERIEGLARDGAVYMVLLDPDHATPTENARLAALAEAAGADIILVGGSLTLSGRSTETVAAVRSAVSRPVVIFPGNAGFLAEGADAVLFLSLLSGRNPRFLIGEHVLAAPAIRRMGLEPIPTGYMLVESGATTSVEFMSDTRPLPRDKPDIAMAHALAAQYLGMKIVFFDAGSGARAHVPEELIEAVSGYVDLPVMVGGGIRTPDEARGLVESGARILVTGDVIERTGDEGLLREMASAVHGGS